MRAKYNTGNQALRVALRKRKRNRMRHRKGNMKQILTLLAGALIFSPIHSYSATTSELETEIKKNDETVSILQDQVSLLEKSLNSQLKISGYADVEYKSSSVFDEPNSFRLHHFSLFFKKQINEKWRFFSEIEFEDAPKIEFDGDPTNCKGCSGKIFVEAVNIDYVWKPQSALRFGRFFTPAGIWSIDHYPPFVPTQERPLHIRKLFPQLVDGAAIFGNIPLSGSFLSYDLYFGNGEGNTAKKDENSSKASGLNLNLSIPTLAHTEFGATFYKDTLNNDDEKTVSGVHTKLIISDFTFQAEYADAEINPVSGTKFNNKGYYGQLYYNYVKWIVGYRYDFLDENTTIANDAQMRNVFFINYRVDKDIVVKLEHVEKEPEDSEKEGTHFTIASVAIYLGD